MIIFKMTILKTIFYNYSQDTSFHGVRYIGSAMTYFGRLCWLILFLSAMGGFIFQATDRIKYYLSKPVTVNVNINPRNQLPMPGVVVCPSNTFRITAAVSSGYYYELEEYYSKDHIKQDNETPKNSTKRENATRKLNKENLHDLLLKLSANKKDFFVSCSFNGDECSYKNFTEIITGYGVCFVFNENIQQKLQIYKTGSSYGFKMLLNSAVYEDMAGPNTASGIQLLPYHQTNSRRVADLGIPASPPNEMMVGLQMEEIKNLPISKGGTCSEKQLEFYPYYSRGVCIDECRTKLAKKTCGCISPEMLWKGDNKPPYCTLNEQVNCIDMEVVDTNCQEECPRPCREVIFVYNVAYTELSNSIKSRVAAGLKKSETLQKHFTFAIDTRNRVINSLNSSNYNLLNEGYNRFNDFVDSLNTFVPNLYASKNGDEFVWTPLLRDESLFLQMNSSLENAYTAVMQSIAKQSKNFKDMTMYNLFTNFYNGYITASGMDLLTKINNFMQGRDDPWRKSKNGAYLFDSQIDAITSFYNFIDSRIQSSLYNEDTYLPLSSKYFEQRDNLNETITKLEVIETKIYDYLDDFNDNYWSYINHKKINPALTPNGFPELVTAKNNIKQTYEAFNKHLTKVNTIIDSILSASSEEQNAISYLYSSMTMAMTNIQSTSSKLQMYKRSDGYEWRVDALVQIYSLYSNYVNQTLKNWWNDENITMSVIANFTINNYLEDLFYDWEQNGKISLQNDITSFVSAAIGHSVTCKSLVQIMNKFGSDVDVHTKVQALSTECCTIFGELDKNAQAQLTLYVSRSTKLHTASTAIVNLVKEYRKSVQIDESFVKNNIVSVSIYYQSLSFKSIEKQQGYTLFSLVCDLGGAAGLFMGASLLTLIETVYIFGTQMNLKDCKNKQERTSTVNPVNQIQAFDKISKL